MEVQCATVCRYMKYLWDHRNTFKEKGNWIVVNSYVICDLLQL